MEVAPATSPGRHIARRRFQASFGRTVDCMFWRIGFRQSSFRHITRVPLHPAPIRLRTVAVFLAGCRSLHLWVQVSHQTQEPPSKSLPTHRGYHQALRGAPVSPRYEGKPRIAETRPPTAMRVVTCGGAPASGSLVWQGALHALTYLDGYVTIWVRSHHGRCPAGAGGREPADDAGGLGRKTGNRG